MIAPVRFAADLLLPDNTTVHEQVTSGVQEAYASGQMPTFSFTPARLLGDGSSGATSGTKQARKLP
jgi:hypothetical protein